MNLGITKIEAIFIKWAIEEFINNHKNDNLNKIFIVEDVDLASIYSQLDMIIMIGE